MTVRFNPTTNTIDVTLDGVTHKLPYIIAEQTHRALGDAIEQMETYKDNPRCQYDYRRRQDAREGHQEQRRV